jgi:hypothetical protein
MEGIYCRRGTQVLVQYGDKAEYLGDARSLQDCSCTGPAPSRSSRSVRIVFDSEVLFLADFVIAHRLSSLAELAELMPSLPIRSHAIAMTMTEVPPIDVVDIVQWTPTV